MSLSGCILTENLERSLLPPGLLSSNGLIRAGTFKVTYTCKSQLMLAWTGASANRQLRLTQYT